MLFVSYAQKTIKKPFLRLDQPMQMHSHKCVCTLAGLASGFYGNQSF